MPRRRKLLLVVCGLFTVMACGSNGDGANEPPPAEPTPPLIVGFQGPSIFTVTPGTTVPLCAAITFLDPDADIDTAFSENESCVPIESAPSCTALKASFNPGIDGQPEGGFSFCVSYKQCSAPGPCAEVRYEMDVRVRDRSGLTSPSFHWAFQVSDGIDPTPEPTPPPPQPPPPTPAAAPNIGALDSPSVFTFPDGTGYHPTCVDIRYSDPNGDIVRLFTRNEECTNVRTGQDCPISPTDFDPGLRGKTSGTYHFCKNFKTCDPTPGTHCSDQHLSRDFYLQDSTGRQSSPARWEYRVTNGID